MTIQLSIIIISWNVAEVLTDCLQSLEKSNLQIIGPDDHTTGSGLTTQVIVVDSASQDETVAIIQERFPWVHLYPQTENVGFVRGNNIGLNYAVGRDIMLLNPDTEVFENTLPRLVEILHSSPTIGVVGPHTFNTDGSHQSSRRRFPTVLVGIFESTWFESMAPSVIERFRVADMPDDGVYPVDWVQGHALLGRSAVWEQIGGLDERYIMFSEELDWCKRAKQAGWEVYYVGDARLVHHGGQSTSQVKSRSHIHFQHSKLRYFRKYHGRLVVALIWTVLLVNYVLQLGLEAVKWLIGHKREMRAERIGTYWMVLCSLFSGERIVTGKA